MQIHIYIWVFTRPNFCFCFHEGLWANCYCPGVLTVLTVNSNCHCWNSVASSWLIGVDSYVTSSTELCRIPGQAECRKCGVQFKRAESVGFSSAFIGLHAKACDLSATVECWVQSLPGYKRRQTQRRGDLPGRQMPGFLLAGERSWEFEGFHLELQFRLEGNSKQKKVEIAFLVCSAWIKLLGPPDLASCIPSWCLLQVQVLTEQNEGSRKFSGIS